MISKSNLQIASDQMLDEQSEAEFVEISVVMPCLNEADTIEHCVKVAQKALSDNDVAGEILIADNGSTDGSAEIAERLGARVVHIEQKGYGNALMGGIEAARGKYVLMGDADASYDFAELPNFLAKLREGNALVQGCRLSTGGGTVKLGAMPFLHRIFGNPFFSFIVRRFFKAPINDVNCGLRGFSKELYQMIDQRCTGMEFAVEMVMKASLYKVPIAEVPITLHPDRRINGQPHLKTFRDGWRTLRFFLLSSPRWLFLYPGMFFIALGIIGYGLALPGLHIGRVGLDVNTLLLASLSIIAGFQTVVFSVSAKTFAISEGLLPEDKSFSKLFRVFTLERGLIFGTLACLVGGGLVAWAFNEWRLVDFGELAYGETLRRTVPGVMFLALGIQTIFSSFFLSILGMKRKLARPNQQQVANA